jgi:hypothetical protein
MTLQPPMQDLVAKDMHGIEWNFRHIYRGKFKLFYLNISITFIVNLKEFMIDIYNYLSCTKSSLFHINRKGDVLGLMVLFGDN